MSCCDLPKLNLADMECREIPNRWTIGDAINTVIFKKYHDKYQFGAEHLKVTVYVKTRLPRKIKKKYKRIGIAIFRA